MRIQIFLVRLQHPVTRCLTQLEYKHANLDPRRNERSGRWLVLEKALELVQAEELELVQAEEGGVPSKARLQAEACVQSKARM